MNYNSICCYDYETGSPDSSTCSIIQIAAEMIHGRNLNVVDKFSAYVRPDWEDKQSTTDETIDWHCRNKGVSKKKFVDMLNECPPINIVWKNFSSWVDKYNWGKTNKSGFHAPVSAGYNILGFDNPITDRHCKLFGPTEKDRRNGEERPRIFNQIYSFDLMQHVWYWFENNSELKNQKLTTVLEYMGVPEEVTANAHDAEFDVEWTSKVIIKLMKTSRWMTGWNEEKQKRRLEFANAFAQEFK